MGLLLYEHYYSTSYSILDTSCDILDTSCDILDTSYGILDTSYGILETDLKKICHDCCVVVSCT